MTVLSSLGIIGGTALSGGVGGWGLMLIWKIVKRRWGRTNFQTGGAASMATAPFPRHLDEADQLLELRQSEGRVATLDTLRGMFLDDELDKLKDDPDSRTRQVIHRVRTAIDSRVDEAAPLTTKV
ncbi:MAG: hypothetical protein DWH91_03085 [Planctomycetota bacterium]|nr:MAG: hypothetical protein DWH91_03085 [Planctomycetota bacterium]